MPDRRRSVPRTDTVLADPRLAAATHRLGRDRIKQAVVAGLQEVRDGRLEAEQVADAVVASLPTLATTLQPVINATGVVLHTNLGRAPLSDAAREAISAACGYVDVEYDVATGRRARRGRGALAALSRAVPNAEDVLIVNNGAAALVLATTTLATGREVVISRGELVEIGDGFRLPDLIVSTGARLREVGTTNRVTRDDYALAIGADTGCVLKVHPSNFRIGGFTSAVPVRELATLGVPVIADVGSGLLAPHPLLPDEPDIASALDQGATVVTASGDKLLGGPQAGLVLGAAAVVERMRRHPLARALRVDKLTLAAVEATLDGPPTPDLASPARRTRSAAGPLRGTRRLGRRQGRREFRRGRRRRRARFGTARLGGRAPGRLRRRTTSRDAAGDRPCRARPLPARPALRARTRRRGAARRRACRASG